MKARDYIKILNRVINNIDQGVHLIDSNGKTILFNKAMSSLKDEDQRDILNKDINEFDDSKKFNLLKEVLITNKVLENKKLTYINEKGKEITTITTIMPLNSSENKLGAVEITKNITGLRELSNKILNLHRKISSPTKIKEIEMKKYDFKNIHTKDYEFEKNIEIAKEVSFNKNNAIITGENGVGKTTIAKIIHYNGKRQSKSVIEQNCSDIKSELLEEILFGNLDKDDEKRTIGILEQCNLGTLILENIETMSLSLQYKLAKSIKNKYLKLNDSKKIIPIDCRILLTSSLSLNNLLKEKKISDELYKILESNHINIPPLRERKTDILRLVDIYINKYNKMLNKNIIKIDEKTKIKLLNYDFRGNISELKNIIYMSVSDLNKNEKIIRDINLDKLKKDVSMDINIEKDFDLEGTMKAIEKKYILKAMKLNHNNISRAAKTLGIKRQTLQHKLKKYNIGGKRCTLD
ncbi:MAG: sigma 54-interacting transcriptional regulator [Peptostreptococcaceae bacterium]|nr:sigma 54-interacting transcriptional regulator [Peptostreptococcaceae bacterium]